TAVAGHEERIRRFAGVLRSLPAWPASRLAPSGESRSLPFGAAIRTMCDGTQTFLEVANDSPYPIVLACVLEAPQSAVIEDLGRPLRRAPWSWPGGRTLLLVLLLFGVTAIRIGAPGVQVASVTPYPSAAVLAGMQAQFRELSAQLTRLNHGLSAVRSEPVNPGF